MVQTFWIYTIQDMTGQILNIGIMGLSPGNGHPYSWSSIFNGYNPAEMGNAGFPSIAAYLAKQRFPDDQIPDARITHVWAQDDALSGHIAKTCRIPYVVKKYEDLIGAVDAVILARDDHEQHAAMAEPFLRAGVPLFVDKPLSISVAKAEEIFAMEQYTGQLFTCSALRYAREFFLTEHERQSIGPLRRIEGSTVKSWDKYAIHVIEPVVGLMGLDNAPRAFTREQDKDHIKLTVCWENGPETVFEALGPAVTKGAISLTYIGENGSITKQFENSFAAFKTALTKFVETVRSRKVIIPHDETIKTIRLIEAGLEHDAS